MSERIINGDFSSGFDNWTNGFSGRNAFALDAGKAKAESKEEVVRYFAEQNVIYHSSGQNESCMLFRCKRATGDSQVLLELKGAKLHQGYYTELKQHNHGVGTLVTNTTGAHDHALGTLAVENDGSHDHAVGTLAGSQPVHSHGVSGELGNATANHTHDVSGTTGVEPDHTHPDITFGSADTGEGGGHDHTFSDTSTGHSVTHSHELGTLAVGNAGNEAVTISGNVASDGTHNHSLSGTVASGGTHNHSLSGKVASDGNHSHTISGSVANAGGSPKTYPDSLKVYINSVDKTSNILTKSGLTKLGNGTSSHAFVTTGTGEMDISDLIDSAAIWEVKITEPVSNKGGRCLLHMEIS